MGDLIQSWDLALLCWSRTFDHQAIVWSAWAVSTIAWKGWLWWLIIGLSWFKGQRLFALEVGLALLIAVVAGLPLKGIISRPRPDLYASQQLNLPMPELMLTTHSFPSGHTLLAAAFGYLVIRRYPRYSWLAVLFVVAVGLARIYQGLHWPSDVVGSVFLGAACAWAAERICLNPGVKRLIERKKKSQQRPVVAAEAQAPAQREKTPV